MLLAFASYGLSYDPEREVEKERICIAETITSLRCLVS